MWCWLSFLCWGPGRGAILPSEVPGRLRWALPSWGNGQEHCILRSRIAVLCSRDYSLPWPSATGLEVMLTAPIFLYFLLRPTSATETAREQLARDLKRREKEMTHSREKKLAPKQGSSRTRRLRILPGPVLGSRLRFLIVPFILGVRVRWPIIRRALVPPLISATRVFPECCSNPGISTASFR